MKLACVRNNFDIFNLLLQLPEIQIGPKCFQNCLQLTQIAVPESVTSIGDYAFSDCANLEVVTIPSTVTSIGNYSFNKCEKLTEIIVPKSVTTIGDNFVSGCTSLRKVLIPNEIQHLGILSFQNFSSLVEYEIPRVRTQIERSEFAGCKSLKMIKIPPTVTLIGKYSFEDCSSLEEITIPSSVRNICFNAFNRCTSLKSITIEQSSKDIDKYAQLISIYLMMNYQLPNYLINKNKIIFDGSYHDVELINNDHQNSRYKLKIVVLGKCGAGKSCFIDRYVTGEFIISMPHVNANIKDKDRVISGNNVRISFYDIVGVRYHSIASLYCANADGAIVTFDLSDPDTFDEVPSFYDVLQKNDEVPKILVGCKCDLEHRVDNVQIQEIAKANDSKYFEVSAEVNMNVNETAEYIISEAFKHAYYSQTIKEKGLDIHNEGPDRANKGCRS